MYYFYKYIVKLFFMIFYRIQITGIENIPENEGFIIAPNHIHFHDPLIIGAFYPGKINLMAKKELFKNKLLAHIITTMGAFPVDRDGNDIKAIKKSLKILKEKKPLLIFPEGTRNPYKGKNHLDGKAGVVLIAVKSKVRIVPVTVDSKYHIFGKIKVIYHEPISLEEFYSQKLSSEEYIVIINKILDQIYQKMELR
ncbi:MAG: 1-acyl-sn-glycerol-3-phosphate acyltransferase [Clostridiales bacterium]|nr:1-acyl-sn-glycerol-3-phosphate acyltransferase [Clostridiales bacterium]